MEQAELERFKLILETMLKNLGQPLQRRDEIAIENAADTVDLCQQATECDLTVHQIESNFSRMRAIKLALARIEDGSYGTCLSCDEEISRKRLQAVPWASYCVRCQEIADREQEEPESKGLQILLRMRDVA